MKISVKHRQIAALIVNAAIVVMEIIGTYLSACRGGIRMFIFYTDDSNILTLITSIVFCIFSVRCLIAEKNEIPLAVKVLRYTSTCCLTVTLVVVLTILIPMSGPDGVQNMLFRNAALFHHLLCPLAAIISFLFLESNPPLKPVHTAYALIPTGIYAVISMSLNIAKVMDGPYPFLHVYEQPVYMTIIWSVVILGGAYILSLLLRIGNKKFSA